MSNKSLNFDVLDQVDEASADDARRTLRRWPRRDPNETVQMSVRMPEETYERFRALCKRERRTNGDMLRVLMEGYLDRGEGASR